MRLPFLFVALAVIGCGTEDREQSIEFCKMGSEYYQRATTILVTDPPDDKGVMADSCMFFMSEAIRVDSSNRPAYWNKWVFENGLERFEAAKKTILLYSGKFNDPYGFMSLAGMYHHRGDTAQSKAYFRRALALYNELIDAGNIVEDSVLFDLSRVNFYNGDIEKSKQYYERYRSTKWGQVTFKEIEFDSVISVLEEKSIQPSNLLMTK
jgi:tetratricopeptide (TPR) repeat protein